MSRSHQSDIYIESIIPEMSFLFLQHKTPSLYTFVYLLFGLTMQVITKSWGSSWALSRHLRVVAGFQVRFMAICHVCRNNQTTLSTGDMDS